MRLFKVKVRCAGTAAGKKLGGPRNVISRCVTVLVAADDADVASQNAVTYLNDNSPDAGVKWEEIDWMETSAFGLPLVLDEGKNIVVGRRTPSAGASPA